MNSSGHTQRAIKASRWVLDKLLFMHNLDWFNTHALTKTVNQPIAVSFDRKRNRSLQESWARYHRRSKTFHRAFSMSALYFWTKTSVMNALHIILYKLSHKTISCYSWWPSCEMTLLATIRFLGDPMSGFGGLSIPFTEALACGVVLFIVLMPHYFRTHSHDLAGMRFHYEPGRELKRIDTLIGLRLNELLESTFNYQWNQHKYYQNEQSFQNQAADNKSITFDRKSVKRMQQEIMSYRIEGFLSLRPEMFQDDSDRLKALETTAWQSIGLYSFYLVWILSLVVPIVVISAQTKCQLMKFVECQFGAVFNLQEAIYLMEMSLFTVIAGFDMSFFSIPMLVQMRCNSLLVDSVKMELKSCLWQLKVGNGVDSESLRVEGEKKQATRRIEKNLLGNYIRILVAGDELKRGMQSMTQLLHPWFIHGCVLVSLLVLVEDVSTKASREFKVQCSLVYWLLLNSFALVCARVSSRTNELQRLYWSIQAELIVYNRRLNLNKSFLELIWKRLANYARNTQDQYAVKPLGITLTYHEIIAYNFSIMSSVTFVLSRLIPQS